ncbi:MAG: hypothetical protein R3275_01400 [Saprospiraceae bacterium]|nr:hypothetical protein [Saprospiraceae bacterium]
MPGVEGYIEEQDPRFQSCLFKLHDYLSGELGLTSRIRYKIPFYDQYSWICYINIRFDKIELAFLRGDKMSRTWKSLDFRGRQQVVSVLFDPEEEIPWQELSATIQEALLLDEEIMRHN